MSENGAERRRLAREKYGPKLKETFKQVDKDNSGFASVEEMWYVESSNRFLK
jgi:Ca2+-binding EF-hand superfamily protein